MGLDLNFLKIFSRLSILLKQCLPKWNNINKLLRIWGSRDQCKASFGKMFYKQHICPLFCALLLKRARNYCRFFFFRLKTRSLCSKKSALLNQSLLNRIRVKKINRVSEKHWKKEKYEVQPRIVFRLKFTRYRQHALTNSFPWHCIRYITKTKIIKGSRQIYIFIKRGRKLKKV